VVETEALHRQGYEFPIELTVSAIKIKGSYEFNAFVRDMGYQPGDWKKAIDTLVSTNTRNIDVGKFTTKNESRYFLNIVGFGFISDVNEDSLRYKKIGNFAYILAVFTALKNLKSYPLTIEIDGKKITRDNVFVEISNSRYTGTTFLMAPQAKLDDGYLDVTLLNKINRRKILKLFPTIFKGNHHQFEEVEVFKAKNIKVTAPENMKLSPDGELLGETPFEVSCLERKLKIFWPEDID
jgi:YegS/Rv2252/BmrU family lipid kinase